MCKMWGRNQTTAGVACMVNRKMPRNLPTPLHESLNGPCTPDNPGFGKRKDFSLTWGEIERFFPRRCRAKRRVLNGMYRLK